jgi:hypothetical protein
VSNVSDLSEDRKRQIREEEERRVAKIKADEEAYREQVRRELAGQPEPPPVEAPQVQAPPVEPPPTARQDRPARAREPKPPRKPRPKKARVILGSSLALVGAVLAYYAYYQGFPIPGIDGPFRSTLTAKATNDLKMADGAEWKHSVIEYHDWTVNDDGKVVLKPDEGGSVPVPPHVAAGTAPPKRTADSSEPEPTEDAGRVSIAGGAISVKLPAGWTVTRRESNQLIVEYAFGRGSALRINFNDVSDRASYPLDDLHAENYAYLTDWVKPVDGFEVTDEFTDDFGSGLTFRVTVVVDPAQPDYGYSILSTIGAGHAVWIVIDGPNDAPDEAEIGILEIVSSLRLSR